MKDEHLDNKGQFKMRLDEEVVVEPPISAAVDELRIEKLSQRVTLISILIPVIIVAVVVIGYMDIKKRVIQTEDTGQLTAESLSKEMESRFDSLIRTQKIIEENLTRLKATSDKSVAKVQINLKKLDDRLKRSSTNMVVKKDLKTAREKLSQNMANIAESIETINLQLEQVAQLESKMAELEMTMTGQKTLISEMEGKLTAFDENKVDKAKLDLALKLEMLKIKQAYKNQIENLTAKLKSVEGKVASQAAAARTQTIKKPEPTSSQPSPAPSTEQLQEQTISK